MHHASRAGSRNADDCEVELERPVRGGEGGIDVAATEVALDEEIVDPPFVQGDGVRCDRLLDRRQDRARGVLHVDELGCILSQVAVVSDNEGDAWPANRTRLAASAGYCVDCQPSRVESQMIGRARSDA